MQLLITKPTDYYLTIIHTVHKTFALYATAACEVKGAPAHFTRLHFSIALHRVLIIYIDQGFFATTLKRRVKWLGF